MAFSLFGLTAAIIQSDFLPHYAFTAASHPTDTRLAQILNRRAARVSGLVDALGLDASALDAVGEPIAFYFCQRLVGVGTAVDTAIVFTGKQSEDGLVATWRREWDEGIKVLSSPQLAKAALVDALGAGSPLLLRTHIQHGGTAPTAAGDVEVNDADFLGDSDL